MDARWKDSTNKFRQRLTRLQEQRHTSQLIVPRQAPRGQRARHGEVIRVRRPCPAQPRSGRNAPTSPTPWTRRPTRPVRPGHTSNIRENTRVCATSEANRATELVSPTAEPSRQVAVVTPSPRPPVPSAPQAQENLGTPPYDGIDLTRRMSPQVVDMEILDLSTDEEMEVVVLSRPTTAPRTQNTEPLFEGPSTSRQGRIINQAYSAMVTSPSAPVHMPSLDPLPPPGRPISPLAATPPTTIITNATINIPATEASPPSQQEASLQPRQPSPLEPAANTDPTPPGHQANLLDEATWPAELRDTLQGIRANIQTGRQRRRTAVTRMIEGQRWTMIVRANGTAELRQK